MHSIAPEQMVLEPERYSLATSYVPLITLKLTSESDGCRIQFSFSHTRQNKAVAIAYTAIGLLMTLACLFCFLIYGFPCSGFFLPLGLLATGLSFSTLIFRFACKRTYDSFSAMLPDESILQKSPLKFID